MVVITQLLVRPREGLPMLETLLINILFLILPILLIVVFFNKQENHLSLLHVFYAISMMLCMFFPFHMEIGFIFDLRYVPFIIVALYGGYRGVLPLYILLNAYRFIIGGDGFWQSFLTSTAVFIIVPLIGNRFYRFNSKHRIVTGISISLILMIVYLSVLSTYFESLTKEFWTLAYFALSTHALVITINMITIEKIIANSKSREDYLRTERLHVMSELSASVSHEIRNPLTVTKGFLQLMEQSKTMTEDNKLYIDYALKELLRAEEIINDYLAFAKPQSEHMIYSNFEEDLRYVKNVLQPFASINNVEISLHLNNTLNVHYDQNQMKQAFINLYKNAIEAMKKDGGILSIKLFEQGKDIVIEIQDSGIGMSNEELLQLGKPYYSNKKEGTGLGMLIVYGIVSQLNGKLDVDSSIGKGTTFTITIPS